MEQHALGHVAGTINGHCFITYEFFPATDYPDWLKELRGHLQTGTSSILLREFNHVDENVQSRVISGNAIKQAAEIADFVEQSPPKDCVLINNENSTVFLRAVRSREIPLVLVGDHPVTAKIAQQVAALPIVLSKIKTEDMVNPVWPEQLAPQSYVIIMTGDHELDFRLCQIALNYQNLKFIGCIGSNKKAQFFHHRLKQQGATEEQLKKLTMPIGLPQINGKQTAVIAASIVAQIMSLHHW